MVQTPAIVVGWKRDVSDHGIILTMQVAGSAEDVQQRHYRKISFVLNERQLRSFTRDLVRASALRGLDVFHEPRGWRRFLHLIHRRRNTGAPAPRTS